MKKDRVGEKNYNNFGSEMIITEYRKYKNYIPKILYDTLYEYETEEVVN